MQQRGLTPLLRRPKDTPVDDERAAELVRAERQRITDELAGLGIEPADELSTTDLAAVERAEQRLREGSYGVSIESGQPIPDARLEAVPTAERTVEEEERRERGL